MSQKVLCDVKMKLCVPQPGYIEALKELLKQEEVKWIHEIFMEGSSDYIGSGRAGFFNVNIEDIAYQVPYAHKHGIRVNVVCNSSCLHGEQSTYNGYKKLLSYFKMLSDADVDAVTIAEPYLVEMLKDFAMETVVSCVAFIDSPQKAIFYEALGADTLTIDPNINRHFGILEDIKDATSCKLKVLVNEGCLYRCPFRYAHFNLISHMSKDMSVSKSNRVDIMGEYYYHKCISMRIRDPKLIITSGWIRPEDISEYEKIGIDYFKISGRTHPVGWIINTTKAYLNRSYHGNLIDILDVTRDLRDLIYVANDRLEGVIEKWKECDKMCKDCGFCEELTHKVVRLNTQSNKL